MRADNQGRGSREGTQCVISPFDGEPSGSIETRGNHKGRGGLEPHTLNTPLRPMIERKREVSSFSCFGRKDAVVRDMRDTTPTNTKFPFLYATVACAAIPLRTKQL